jgi:hypothetical protein
MATNGSYIFTPRDCSDILTSEFSIRDTGKSADGIVCDSPPPSGSRITWNRAELVMNAFTGELVTQLIGLYFSKYIQSPLMAIYDCTGAIARTNRALKTKYNPLVAYTRDRAFTTGAHEFTHLHIPQ